MSWDYAVVVKARKRKLANIRELAARLAKSYEAELLDPDDDAEDDDDDGFDLCFGFAAGGGTIEVSRLRRGYRLYLDSQRGGNRGSWEDIGGLANDLAAKLGTVIDDAALASEMIAESEGDEQPDADGPGIGPGDVAVVRVEARDGTLIQELLIAAGVLLQAVDGAGRLRDDALTDHPILTEEGRYQAKVARIVATLRGPTDRAYRRHRWSCDGYGRILAADVEDL
jgi:hypothetical protein